MNEDKLITIKARLMSLGGETVAEVTVPAITLDRKEDETVFIVGLPPGIEYGGITYLSPVATRRYEGDDNTGIYVYYHAFIMKL